MSKLGKLKSIGRVALLVGDALAPQVSILARAVVRVTEGIVEGDKQGETKRRIAVDAIKAALTAIEKAGLLDKGNTMKIPAAASEIVEAAVAEMNALEATELEPDTLLQDAPAYRIHRVEITAHVHHHTAPPSAV